MRGVAFAMVLFCALCTQVYAYTPLNVFSDTEITLSAKEQIELSEAIFEFWENLNKESFSQETSERKAPSRWRIQYQTEDEQIVLKITDNETDQVFYQSFTAYNKLKSKHANHLKFDIDSRSSENLSQTLEKMKEIDPIPSKVMDTAPPEEIWGDHEKKVIQEVMQLEKAIADHWAGVIAENNLSEKQMKEWIVAGKVHLKDPYLGSAEINMIDETPFVRVTHASAEISFAIFDRPMDYESSHFKQYVARQHIDAGSSRTDGKLGRDLVVIAKNPKVSHNGFYDSDNYTSFKKPKSFISTQWWEEYFRATYKKPDAPTVGFGTVCGLSQGALGLCVAGLNKLVDPTAPMDLTPATFSTIWGTGIGAFVSTYKNWINRGTKLMRTIKSSANSVIFAYGLVGMIHPDGFQALTVLDAGGLFLHAGILGNVWANNMAKVYWNDFARVREFTGISRKNFVMKLPFGKKWETKIAQSAVESQSIYLAPFTIRLLDLTSFTIGSFPMGKFLLWSSIPAVEFAVLKYLEKMALKTQHPKAVELAREHRRQWELKKMFFRDKEMRNLILKKIYYKLTFQKKKYRIMKALLARKYPTSFKYHSEKQIQKAQHNYSFQIPNEKRYTPKGKFQTCKEIYNILLGR